MSENLQKKPSASFTGRALEKFRDARQAALEKIGKTENTVEPEALKRQTAILEQHNALLTKEAKSIGKNLKQESSAVDDGMAIADSFAESATYFKTVDAPAEFVELFELMAEFHVGVEDLRLELNSATADVADSLRALTKAEVRHAKATKGKYDKVRLTYEAKVAGRFILCFAIVCACGCSC
jgi:phosphoglycolate phosphatase-like HAD superfamily hydrolase